MADRLPGDITWADAFLRIALVFIVCAAITTCAVAHDWRHVKEAEFKAKAQP